MAVNITDSVGYEGTVDEPQWARLMAYAGGRQYGVLGAGDWKVSAGTADREVRIATGGGFGAGVLDRTVAIASLTLAAPAAGSRWHLIAVRRDWQSNRSSFDSIAGGQGAASIPARNVTPGTADDQPIALVQVTAGQTQVTQIIDLRVWGGDGGSYASDELVLQYMTRLGTRLRIGRATWTRVLDALGTAQWSSYREPARGFVNVATEREGQVTPAGTITVSHDLGVVPTSVVITDRKDGAYFENRKIVFVTANASQIQFAAYLNGQLMVNTPVAFNWAAFA